MKAGGGVISGGGAFRSLIYTLLFLVLLAASAGAISKRSEVFVGYAEKNEQHSKCSDSMDAEVCASYKKSRMCKTGTGCFEAISCVCNLICRATHPCLTIVPWVCAGYVKTACKKTCGFC